ncbi:hypothetical protein SAMN04487870_3292, partial [Pseudoalteromonas sp. DSM 26666]
MRANEQIKNTAFLGLFYKQITNCVLIDTKQNSAEPRTPNPEPRTPNPEPRTPNPEPRTPN